MRVVRVAACLFLVLLLCGCGKNSTPLAYVEETQATTTVINIYINNDNGVQSAPAATATPSEAPTADAAVPTVPSSTDASWQTLEISMPDANGIMQVDTAPQNRFTQIVATGRGIDTRLLIAVYSEPDTGQNYVVEFDGTKASDGSFLRTTGTFRRLYLIDTQGAIESVASVNEGETENISSVENWFCVNVFIKGLMLPKIEDVMQKNG